MHVSSAYKSTLGSFCKRKNRKEKENEVRRKKDKKHKTKGTKKEEIT
jgi:hypothetical protein